MYQDRSGRRELHINIGTTGHVDHKETLLTVTAVTALAAIGRRIAKIRLMSLQNEEQGARL
jgi:translation elongation factor EF-Tu-like GTPase